MRERQDTAKLYSLDRAADALSVTRRHIYNLINRGELRSVKVGRRRFITDEELDRYVTTLSEG